MRICCVVCVCVCVCVCSSILHVCMHTNALDTHMHAVYSAIYTKKDNDISTTATCARYTNAMLPCPPTRIYHAGIMVCKSLFGTANAEAFAYGNSLFVLCKSEILSMGIQLQRGNRFPQCVCNLSQLAPGNSAYCHPQKQRDLLHTHI